MVFRPRPIRIVQGDTFSKGFRRRLKSTGQAADFPAMGATAAILQIRDKAESEGGVVLVELTTANGGIDLTRFTDGNGKQWSGQLYMSAAATAQLKPWGDAQYQLKVYDPSYPGAWAKTIFFGPAILVPLTAHQPGV